MYGSFNLSAQSRRAGAQNLPISILIALAMAAFRGRLTDFPGLRLDFVCFCMYGL
jgi:hypothetical protein